MIAKRGKNVSGFWPNYKRLPIIFLLYVVLCLISTPLTTWAIYTYAELLPPGWIWARAHGINNKGVVVGQGSDSYTAVKGFLYSEGTYTELLPPGWIGAYANGINDKGVIVGCGYDATNALKGFIATPYPK